MPEVHLADGRTVPAEAVQALDRLEAKWPGATFPQARAAIAAAVIEAVEGLDLKALEAAAWEAGYAEGLKVCVKGRKP